MNFNYGIAECNEYFNDHRFNTRCKGYTRNEFLEDPPLHIGYVQRFVDNNILKKGSLYETLMCCYDIYFGTVTNFRPSEAHRIFTKYNPTCIVDPCAGWGGRCMAAMTAKIPYIGFDTNTDLRPAYDALISKHSQGTPAHVNFEDSATADFSKYTYDMIFTSPPYWNREEYRNMPNYKNKKDWVANFLRPMLLNSYKHLAPGGHLCMNVPSKMYPLLVDIMGEAHILEPYKKTARNITKYTEYIYIWRKPLA
jgi:hypothetical protein